MENREALLKMKLDLKQMGADITEMKADVRSRQRAGEHCAVDTGMRAKARCLHNGYCMVRNVPYRVVESSVSEGNELYPTDLQRAIEKYTDTVSYGECESWLTR